MNFLEVPYDCWHTARSASQESLIVMPALDLRRLEEISQNASRPERGLMLDGWSIGLSPGLAKRSRCINPFYPGTRPFERNLADAREAFAQAKLPCTFRITPYISDAGLDDRLDALGYVRFDEALVQVLPLAELNTEHLPAVSSAAIDIRRAPDFAIASQWVGRLRGDTEEQAAALAARWQINSGVVTPEFVFLSADNPDRVQLHATDTPASRCVARSVTIREGSVVGIFDVGTDPAFRNRGLAGALLAHQLRHAQRTGADVAYLQVTPDNPSRRIYERFGFRTAYRYWYRALPEDADPR